VCFQGKAFDLGTFETEEDAARHYDEQAVRQGRPPLNFPEKPTKQPLAANPKYANKSEKEPSKYVGVSWNRKNQKWVVQICIDGKQIYLGSFAEEDEVIICQTAVVESNIPSHPPTVFVDLFVSRLRVNMMSTVRCLPFFPSCWCVLTAPVVVCVPSAETLPRPPIELRQRRARH
jgi:hypothetical protein